MCLFLTPATSLCTNLTLKSIAICISPSHIVSNITIIKLFASYSFIFLTCFKKPIYNGYCLASHLGGQWLETGEEDCIATVNERGDIIIALYGLSDGVKTTSVRVCGLNGDYEVKRTRIDRINANAFGQWTELGKPELDEAVRQEIAERSELKTVSEKISVSGEYIIETVFDGAGIELIELIK